MAITHTDGGPRSPVSLSEQRNRCTIRGFPHRVLVSAIVGTFFIAPLSAYAEDDLAKARASFSEGTDLVAKARWGEALAAFERARELRNHPITTYNMAACERALGRFTRARALYLEALDGEKREPAEVLPPNLEVATVAALAEIDKLLVRVTVGVRPEGSPLAVDGRRLVTDRVGFVTAGLGPFAAGNPTPVRTFILIVDPGPHVFRFTRQGFRDLTIVRTFEAGSAEHVDGQLAEMPATVKVSANARDALVMVDGTDAGRAPIDVVRHAGPHRIVVRSDGFVAYEVQLLLEPGEVTSLRAKLVAENRSIFSRWWFWTAAGVVAAGAITATVLATRPASPPDLDGGTLGWRVNLP